MRPIRLALDNRGPAVRSGANRHVQRNLAEERYSEALGLMTRAAMPENIRLRSAVRTLEIAHVLDDAEHGHVDLLEHRQSPPRVDQRQILRRRDDDGALQRYILRQRQLRVAGTRRHI